MSQPESNQTVVVRPTVKRAVFGLGLAFLFFLVVLWLWLKVVPEWPWQVMLFAALPLLGPLIPWIDSRRVRLELDDHSARYVHGLISQTTRNLVLRNITDVRVERSLAQRMWNIGTLVIEMPGENGRVIVQDVDKPQEAASRIVKAARSEGATPRHG